MKDPKKNGGKSSLATLIPLKVKSVQPSQNKGEIPVIRIEGDAVSRYNEASAVEKEAKALMEDLKPLMRPDAMAVIYRHNNDRPWDPLASVKLQDDKDEILRVTFANKYPGVAPAVAEALFQTIRTKDGKQPDINLYLSRTLVGAFDSGAFLGQDGRFDQKRYQKLHDALEAASRELGIENPLSTSEIVQPVPDFHGRRWLDFDLPTNRRISEVIPNQTSFVPQPNAAKTK
jgi:hypothetical protein